MFWEWYFWYHFEKSLIHKLAIWESQKKAARMQILGIWHDIRIFFIEKGSLPDPEEG